MRRIRAFLLAVSVVLAPAAALSNCDTVGPTHHEGPNSTASCAADNPFC